MCSLSSLKIIDAGKLHLLYEAQVLTWSNTDFVFKYHASTTNPFGGVLLQTPSTTSIDQRDMFSLYLYAGPEKSRKVCRKEVLFVVNISESMKDNTIETTKSLRMHRLQHFQRLTKRIRLALEMFFGTSKSISMVFFITDEAVENERQICDVMQRQLQKKGS